MWAHGACHGLSEAAPSEFPFLEVLYHRAPFRREVYLLALLGVVEHHDGLAHAFLLAVLAHEPLPYGEAAVAYVRDGRLYRHLAFLGIDLLHEVGLNVHGDDGELAYESRTHRAEIFHLRRVVKLEIHGVVYMPEGVGVHPAQLDGHGVVVFYLLFLVYHHFYILFPSTRPQALWKDVDHVSDPVKQAVDEVVLGYFLDFHVQLLARGVARDLLHETVETRALEVGDVG